MPSFRPPSAASRAVDSVSEIEDQHLSQPLAQSLPIAFAIHFGSRQSFDKCYPSIFPIKEKTIKSKLLNVR